MPTVPYGGFDPDLLTAIQPTKPTQLLAKLTTPVQQPTMPQGLTKYPDPLKRPPKKTKFGIG